jgi:VWFA-related protein
VNGKNQRTELRVRLVEIPLEDGRSYDIFAEVLKVQGEKASGGINARGAAGGATNGAVLGALITRGAKGAAVGAIAGAVISVLGSAQPRGPTSDVDLPSGSIFEAKLERPLHVPRTAIFAKTVPTPSTPRGTGPPPPDIADASSTPDIPTRETSSSASSVSTVPAVSSAEASSPEVPVFDSTAAPTETAEGAGPAEATAGPVTTSKPTVLRVDVNLVQVDAVVRDRAGRPMNNLRKEDFVVLEDGSERPIQFFSRDQLPLAVALVIDRSGSVAPMMNDVQNAAYQALKLLKPGDEVCLFSFSGSVELLEELTEDRQRVANHIGRIQAGGGTAIVDAVSEALHYLEATAPDRRGAVILVSDNIEGRSIATVEHAISFALESEAAIYSVKVGNDAGGLFGIPKIPGIPAPRLPLPGIGSDGPVKTITRETGGEIFDATGGASIATALTTAVDRLKLRYTLSYAGASRSSTKGGYHRIEVRLVSRFGKPDADYTIHHRSGYYDSSTK